MPVTDRTNTERARLMRYRDALARIANPGEDKAAAQRSAEDMREIALKALRPYSKGNGPIHSSPER